MLCGGEAKGTANEMNMFVFQVKFLIEKGVSTSETCVNHNPQGQSAANLTIETGRCKL